MEVVIDSSMCHQAEKLDDLLKKRGIGIDKVLNFDVPDSTLVRHIKWSTHFCFKTDDCMMYVQDAV